ncbi:MAG: hypothetical protein GWP08_04190 [Nitrospiraceae bacterium]|nr:hypothetical protein [Nitrospiraceae bacterium]
MKLLVCGLLVCVVLLRAGPCAAGAVVRVMTYNIHHAEGLDGKVDVDRIAGVIKSARPDIVCLQEVDAGMSRTGRVDMPAQLAERLNMQVAFGPNLSMGKGKYGNATLTRHRIVAQENLPLPNPAGQEPRGCLRTAIEVDGVKVIVLNVHLGLEEGERLEQARALVAIVNGLPTVLAGDMNEEADAPGLATLTQRMRDTAAGGEAAKAATYPAGNPESRIDFILVSGAIDVLSSRVLSEPDLAGASDHRPYVADLTLRPAPDEAAERGVHDNDDERVTEAFVEGS